MVLRVCCLVGSVLTLWGRRMLLSMASCAPGCHDWARLSYWTWVESLSTLMERSATRTCLTSFTWRWQVTVMCPSPSMTCCSKYWRRCQRRDGHHWFEGRGQAAHLSRGMSHSLLWKTWETCPWFVGEEGLAHRGMRYPDVSEPTRGVGWHSWAEVWVWRAAAERERERPHYRCKHCECSSKCYCKGIYQVRLLWIIDRYTEITWGCSGTRTLINLGLWKKIKSVFLCHLCHRNTTEKHNLISPFMFCLVSA